tara:strand:+ start:2017 stop:2334 length:318 start_codon:yes stop_codon:yes gene_type:complete
MVDTNLKNLGNLKIKNQILNTIKPNLSKDLSLEDVAQEFESIFINQMLKSARSAKLANGLMDNDAFETYQGLLDQEYSKMIAKNHNFGIAEGLIRQFGKNINRIK